ncbi:MAG: DegT/DnrJ/EryC1/StrS family aminotransferase [Ethanoligenens sp.]
MSNAFIADVPLYAAVRAYAETHPLRLHTPGHAGKADALSVFGNLLSLDVTELPETDSLFEADGPIRAAEEKAARAFGASHTLFSAGGATLCIQAMLRLASQSGNRRVVIARGAHRSAIHAMSLLDLEPIWVWPEPFKDSSLPGVVPPQAVEQALAGSGAACVYVTSPDYYGILSDIEGIAAVCRRHDVPLLVDGAHGAHLHYLEGGVLHPLAQGADLVCDSAHKTLPVLTGGAFLQMGATRFSRDSAKDAMALFGSSSPSYLILLSLDLARAWGEQHGKKAFAALQARVNALYDRLAIRDLLPPPAPRDPVRITLDVGRVGLSGAEADSWLRKRGISIEMHDDRHIVMLPSVFHDEADFAALTDALTALPIRRTLAPAIATAPEHPDAAMTPGEALRAACERLPVEQTAGRVAAEGCCPCPPGIPLVCPGERISASLAAALKNYGVNALNVIK